MVTSRRTKEKKFPFEKSLIFKTDLYAIDTNKIYKITGIRFQQLKGVLIFFIKYMGKLVIFFMKAEE